MTYNFIVDIRKKTKPLNPFPMVALIIGLILSNLTTLSIIVWSLKEPDIKQGWKKILQRVKESREMQYSPEDIQRFFRAYWDLIADVQDCTNMHAWQKLGIEIDAFQKAFRDKVPDALMDRKYDSLAYTHNKVYTKLSKI